MHTTYMESTLLGLIHPTVVYILRLVSTLYEVSSQRALPFYHGDSRFIFFLHSICVYNTLYVCLRRLFGECLW
jgi:hypothetical protein